MPIHKIYSLIDDRAFAHEVAGVMQDVVDPAPDALTLFEDGGQWRMEAYCSERQDADEMGRRLAAALDRPAPRLAVEAVPELNWVAISQAALPPVRAGRFRVHGSHDRARVSRGPGAIEIEAGEAFGTAHHATTFGCLEAIDRLARRRSYRNVLDLGCGTGVLAIAAARALPRAAITASDLDARSVEVARENIRLNGAAGRIRVREAAGLAHPELRRGKFDLVIANILAGPLVRLAPQIARAVRPRGTIVLSGLLVPQAPAIIAAYRAAGFALETRRTVSGWTILALTRRWASYFPFRS